jgi:hypothetical protein
MSIRRWLLLGCLSFSALGSFGPAAHALDPNTVDARAIAQAVLDRNDGDRSSMQATLTVVDQGGRERTRKLKQFGMKFAGGRKSLIFFESPADVRNTGFLSFDYDDGERDDDQWLYLPSLRKSMRIASADRSGSFMGTDITYSDMTKKDTKQYDYELLENSVKVDGEDCWVIEARPRNAEEREETGYLKTQSWISKSKLMLVQFKAWVIEGKKIKYMKFGDFRRIDGVWIAQMITVRVARAEKVESTTTMKLENVRFFQDAVQESQFSERRLEQGL